VRKTSQQRLQAAALMPLMRVAEQLSFPTTGGPAWSFDRAAHGHRPDPELTLTLSDSQFSCETCGARGDAVGFVRGILGRNQHGRSTG
jgi:hypothetical protein